MTLCSILERIDVRWPSIVNIFAAKADITFSNAEVRVVSGIILKL